MDELKDKLIAVIDAGLTENGLKSISKQVQNIIDDIDANITYRLKEELSSNLSSFCVEMANKSVEALLAGNIGKMKEYLRCRDGYYNGRSDGESTYFRKKEPHEQHPVIHGNLFEAEGIAIRRKIVEAHRDLITDQRILDLEDQVKSLVAQVNKEKAETQRA